MPVYSQDDFLLPSGLSQTQLNKEIEDYIIEHKDTTASVAISVFNDKKDLYLGYHGYSNLENQDRISENTVFEWGSISKLFIWVSVFQLWEQGKIDLDEDIRTYLPEGFLKKANKNEKITMLNLMHHAVGLQEVIADSFVYDIKNVQDLKETLQKTEPEQIYPVGRYSAYSNWSSSLAAYIVEEISGEKYYQYVIDNIFKPLNMKNTSILPDLSDNLWVQENRKIIKGYTKENKIIPNDFGYIPLYPSGMITGTMKDLEKFAKHLINYSGKQNLFRNEETLKKLFYPTLNYGDTGYSRNANGFWFTELGVSTLGHAGNTIAFSSNLLIDPLTKTSTIILTNQSNEKVYTSEMLPLIFGAFSPSPSYEKTRNEGNLSGVYQGARTIKKGYGKLYSLFTRIKIEDKGHGKLEFFWPGISYTAYEFEPSLYNLEGSLFHIYKTTDDTTVISTAYTDFFNIRTSQIIIEYAIIFLALLAALYCIIMIIIEFVGFINCKKRNKKSSRNF